MYDDLLLGCCHSNRNFMMRYQRKHPWATSHLGCAYVGVVHGTGNNVTSSNVTYLIGCNSTLFWSITTADRGPIRMILAPKHGFYYRVTNSEYRYPYTGNWQFSAGPSSWSDSSADPYGSFFCFLLCILCMRYAELHLVDRTCVLTTI